MARVVAYTLMSLDNAVDDPSAYFPPSGSPDDPFALDEETEAFEAEVVAGQDVVLLGRGMYDEWARFWPTVTDNPFATFINGVRKHVVTSRPLTGGWSNAHAVRTESGDLAPVVADAKARAERDVGVHGSIRLLQSLLDQGLVDELRLVVGPVTGAPGRRLFEPRPAPAHYTLTAARGTTHGNLLLTYETRRGAANG